MEVAKKEAENEKKRSAIQATRAIRTPEQKATDNQIRKEQYANMEVAKKEAENAKKRSAIKLTRAIRTPEQKANDSQIRKEQYASMEESKKEAQKAKKRESYQPKKNQGINFDLNTEDFDPKNPGNFEDFTEDPERAALLFHANSGHLRFRQLEQLCNEDGTINDIALASVEKELNDEILTCQENEDVMFNYAASQGRRCSQFQPSPELKAKHDEKQQSITGIPTCSLDAEKLVCGACGIQSVHGRYGKYCRAVPLQDLPDGFILSKEDLQQYEELKKTPPLHLPLDGTKTLHEVHLHKLQSVYESQKLGKSFHLHPEFVHLHQDLDVEDQGQPNSCEMTIFCPNCSEWLDGVKKLNKTPNKACPPNSIASGIDFGDPARIGLVKPSPIEILIIAKHRHFHQISKVNQNHRTGERSDFTANELRCHDILFRHDASITASIALMFFQWIETYGEEFYKEEKVEEELKDLFQKLLTIQLVAPENALEVIAKKLKMQTHLRARPWVIFQWLCVLQQIHPLYKDDPKLKPEHFRDFEKLVQQCNDTIMETTTGVTDESVRNADKVVGDDVAQVRTAILKEGDMAQIAEECSACNHQYRQNVDSTETPADSMNVSSCFVANASLLEGYLKHSKGTDDNAPSENSSSPSTPTEPGQTEQSHQDSSGPEKSDAKKTQQGKEILELILQTAEALNVKLPLSLADADSSGKTPTKGGTKKHKRQQQKKQKKGTNPSDYVNLHKKAWTSE